MKNPIPERPKEVVAVEDGYKGLFATLCGALEQAQNGKGKERHAEPGQAFEDQPILEITRRLERSPVAWPLGQAVKKIYETVNLGTHEQRIHELKGAINFIAAAIIRLEELAKGA